MSVRDMLARIDAHELAEWMAYYSLDPWGPERADFNAGTIAATVANCHTTKGTSFKPSDFVVRFGEEERKQQTPDDLRRIALKCNAMFKGSVT